MTNQNADRRLADYLPYEYRKKAENGAESDTIKFLKAFDRILLGGTDDNEIKNPGSTNEKISKLNAIEGLEDKIARLADYMNPAPDKTPPDFLPWLSQWAALSLRADISEQKQREFISRIIQLYQKRGTIANMVMLLEMFTGKSVSITEHAVEPHYFQVLLNLNDLKDGNSTADYDRAEQQAHSIIRLAKPAHTRYQLIPQIDTFRIGPYNSSTVDPHRNDSPVILGKNTRLGIANWIITK